MPDIETVTVVIPQPLLTEVDVVIPGPLITTVNVFDRHSGLSGYSGYSGGSGYSGYSGPSGYSGFSGPSGYSGYSGSGVSGYSGYSGSGTSGYSGFSGFSGYSGFSSTSGYSGFSSASGYSGFCGLSGYSGFSGNSGYSGFSGSGISGYSGYSGSGISGYSGFCGLSGYSGFCGLSGYSGFSAASPGASGYSGFCGASGYSGFCGASGYSGFSGKSGYSGYSGQDGVIGHDGASGYSGYSAASPGASGFSGYSGFSGVTGGTGVDGASGFSGFSGKSGYSGFCGLSGYSGFSAASPGASGYSGFCGLSGYSGFCGLSGYSGFCGLSGYSGFSGFSGYSGFSAASPGASGFSGYSGFCGLSGYSGFCGLSGYSGFCGLSGYSGFSGKSGYSGFRGAFGGGCVPYVFSTTTTDSDPGSGKLRYNNAAFNSITQIFIDNFDAVGDDVTSWLDSFDDSGTSTDRGFIEIIQDGTFLYQLFRLTGSVVDGTGYRKLTVTPIVNSGLPGDLSIISVSFSRTGVSGYSGYSGFCGLSGYSGFCGLSGYSGFCGLSGYSGFCGATGAGTSGFSGYSGFCGLSGYSGFCGLSGYSGYSGPSLLLTTTQTDTDYTLVLGDAQTCVKMSSASAHTLTIPLNATVAFPLGTQIVIEQGGTAAVTIAITATGTLQGATSTTGQYTEVVLIKQATDTWLSATGSSGYSGYSGLSGYSGYSAYSGYSGPSGGSMVLSVTQNIPLSQVVGTIVSKAGTVTGAVGVGSSLFLHRMNLPGRINLSEIDIALSIGFPVTSQGAGTLSRSLVVYSFGNSTSLASVLSISGTSAWATGTATAGGNTSLTQYQGGWSAPYIQPMTFASSSISAGDYVVGQIFNFAQGSSTWTLNFYGAQAASSFLASAATNLTSATIGAVSVATAAGSGITGVSSYASQFLALSTAGSMTEFRLSGTLSTGASSLSAAIGASATTATVAGISRLDLTITNSAKSVSFQLAGNAANSNIISSIGTVAGSIVNGLTTLGAVTNVALGALNSSTLAQLAIPNFNFIGTAAATSTAPTAFQPFMCGIMSTGAVPTAITLTSTAVTYSGSYAFQQPWFSMVGA